MAAQAVVAAKAYVMLGQKGAEAVTKSLKAIQDGLKNIGEAVGTAGKKMALLGGAITGGLLGATKRFETLGSEIYDFSQRTGVASDTASRLKYVAQQAGAELGDMEIGFRKLSQAVVSGDDSLAKYGLNFQALKGMSPEDMFVEVGNAIGNLQNAQERMNAAQELFGRGGLKLIPIFRQGREAIRAQMKEADRLGIVFGGRLSDAADRLGDSWQTLKAGFDGIAIAIGEALLPIVEPLIQRLTDVAVWIKDWIKSNPVLVQQVLKLGASLVAAGTALMVVGKALTMISALMNPVVLAFAGLAIAIVTFDKDIKKLGGDWLDSVKKIQVGSITLGEVFQQLSEIAKTVWLTFEAAAEIAFDKIKIGIVRFAAFIVETLGAAFDKVVNWLQDTWIGKLGRMVPGGGFFQGLARGFSKSVSGLAGSYASDLEEAALKMESASSRALGGRLDTISKSASSAIEKIKGLMVSIGLGSAGGDIAAAAKVLEEYEEPAPIAATVSRIAGTFSGRGAAMMGMRGETRAQAATIKSAETLQKILDVNMAMKMALEKLGFGAMFG